MTKQPRKYTPRKTPGPKPKQTQTHLGAASTPTSEPAPEQTTKAPQTETPTAKAPLSEKERWAKAEARRDKYQNKLLELGAIGDQRLVAPTRTGFRRYWGNDDGNRLAHLLNKGYDFVPKGSEGVENVFSDDPGDKISQVVGTKKNGGALRAYLLEIPEGWHEENLEQKEQMRRTVEKDLKRASHDGGKMRSADGSSVAYVPKKGSSSHFDV